MMTRCAVCGAPLAGRVCEYCGTPAANTRKGEPYFGGYSYGNNDTSWNYSEKSRSAGETRFDSSTRKSEPAAASYRPAVSTKSKWVALILCLTLGWLGTHRFYVGKVGTGFLYLVTRGFHGAGIVLDIILILTGSFDDGDGLPLRE